MRALPFLALSILGTSPALAAAPSTLHVETVSSPAQIDETTQTEDVRFQNERHDRMTVPVLLSGTGPYRFLVDTGADRTAISRDIATRLGLQTGEKASLHSVAGVSKVTTATVPSLQVTREPVRIADAPLLDSFNMGADGILG